MGDRGSLHVDKLDDFMVWLSQNGWTREKKKGYYEVLRMTRPKSKTPKGRSSVLLVHERAHDVTHYSLHGESSYWFRKWIRERRKDVD